jgi:hypothetical protein
MIIFEKMKNQESIKENTDAMDSALYNKKISFFLLVFKIE